MKSPNFVVFVCAGLVAHLHIHIQRYHNIFTLEVILSSPLSWSILTHFSELSTCFMHVPRSPYCCLILMRLTLPVGVSLETQASVPCCLLVIGRRIYLMCECTNTWVICHLISCRLLYGDLPTIDGSHKILLIAYIGLWNCEQLWKLEH